MWLLLKILCCITFFANIQGEWNSNDYLRREHSIIKPYQGSIPHWDLLGNTIVTPNYIRLTDDQQSRNGGIWNSVACMIRNWELQIHFKIHGRGKELFGDGLAVWYTRDRMIGGPVFGSANFFWGLGIFLDTYSNHNGQHNHQHPYISAMINNGSLHYDHDKDGTHTQLAGCEAKLRNLDHETHIAIRYEGDTLTVSTDIDNKQTWKTCFSTSGIQLPTGYYFGVSSATGDLSDNHDIYSIRLYELNLEPNEEDRTHIIPSSSIFEAPRPRSEDTRQMNGFKIFCYILFGSLFAIGAAILGFFLWKNYEKNSKKRFY